MVKSHSPRGGARKKRGAKTRADEQEADKKPTVTGKRATDFENVTDCESSVSFTSEREPRRRMAPKATVRFKERIRELTRRTRGISLPKMVADTATYLRGRLGYFGECQTPSMLKRLESWLRRRLRSVVWKQWKRGRTRFKELRKRGVSKDLAAQTGGSAHGPWRIANSPALNIALANAYFHSLALTAMVVRS